MQKVVRFADLAGSDLFIDALYKGGTNNNASDDPINKLVKGGNQGGFRYVGRPADITTIKLVTLYTSLDDPDWPDAIDPEAGSFIYFGDNKRPGHELHDTPRSGNVILRNIFAALHAHRRSEIPPILIFSKAAEGRDVVFRGLCVPGFHGYSQSDNLVAVWRTKDNQRFQNYRAIFSILDVACVERRWIDDIFDGRAYSSPFCPEPLLQWIDSGNARLLSAPKTREYRTREEQTPNNSDLRLLSVIYDRYRDNPYAFEKCAAEVVKLMDRNFISYDLTRPWQDGGRDAIGIYKIGLNSNAIKVVYALEAKCYSIANAVGVRETSRLISRIRHRQFGVLVTTSYVHHQAYKEIVDDGHPVIIVCGKDIIEVLRSASIKTEEDVSAWLDNL